MQIELHGKQWATHMLCVACLLSVGTSLRAEVRVTQHVTEQGAVEIEINGADSAPHALRLAELSRGETISVVNLKKKNGADPIWRASIPSNAPAGVYKIAVLDREGRELVIHRESLDKAEDVQSASVDIDRRRGELKWPLPRCALVRINAGLRDGMFIRTLMPWTFCGPGQQSVPWDFWDAEHIANYRDHPGLSVHAMSLPLPPDLVVVGRVRMDNDYLASERLRGLVLQDEDYSFDVTISGSGAVRRDGYSAGPVPSVAVGQPVQVSLSPSSRRSLARDRFELLFF